MDQAALDLVDGKFSALCLLSRPRGWGGWVFMSEVLSVGASRLWDATPSALLL